MTTLFGTDGVRGTANSLLTPELAISLARATAARMMPEGGRIIIGRDPRSSGPMLESALAAGFASAGVDVCLAGVIPTPAISFLIKDERADLGAVISASHNPPGDNGIKFFDPLGMKLSIADEETIEASLGKARPASARVGTIGALEAAATRYAAFLTGTIDMDRIDLSGATIVVDCAFGATSVVAPHVLRHLGARVIPLHGTPDGDRINQECGSTHLVTLRAAVLEHGADLGVAFDGDGDRVMLIAADGSTIDGDRMIGVAAMHMMETGAMASPAVVTTIMSNLGLETWLADRGIDVVRTPVGDRYVSRAMRERGLKLGGEPSGHVIFSEFSPTGDGILTAVKLLEIAHERNADLGELAKSVTLYPQILRNVPVEAATAVAERDEVRRAVADATESLGGNGRVVVRASGTQPLVRIMVEADREETCIEVAARIEAVIRSAAG